MPVNWMEVLLGATNIGKSLQNIKAFNELRQQRDIQNTQPIEEWIKKYGYTPELGKLGPEFDRYLSSRGINLPRTIPQGASGQPDASYDVPQNEPLTARSQSPDTSLLGRMMGAQKSGPRGYVGLPDPTHEQMIEREKLKLMKEPDRAREQAEIAAGMRRTGVDQEKFDIDKGRARIQAINAIANNTDASLKDVQEYVDAILENKTPSKDLPAKETEAKLHAKVLNLQKQYNYLDGKNRNRTPLTDDENVALAALVRYGGAKITDDGTIQIVPVEEPKITVERNLPPDPSKGETLPSNKYSYTNMYKNGKLLSRLPSERSAASSGEDKPESWHGKGLERAAMNVLTNEMYDAWASKQEPGIRNITKFMEALTGGFKSEQPNFQTGLSYLPPARQKEINADLIRASEIMRKEKLDEYAAYNKAVWERAGKKGETNPNKETKSKSYSSPEEVKALFQAGHLTKEEATQILREQFKME